MNRIPPCGASYFAHGGKVGKAPPGGSFNEHMAYASVHRRRPPDPLVTGAGHFGLFVISGGLSFDCAPLYSRPTGTFFH